MGKEATRRRSCLATSEEASGHRATLSLEATAPRHSFLASLMNQQGRKQRGTRHNVQVPGIRRYPFSVPPSFKTSFALFHVGLAYWAAKNLAGRNVTRHELAISFRSITLPMLQRMLDETRDNAKTANNPRGWSPGSSCHIRSFKSDDDG